MVLVEDVVLFQISVLAYWKPKSITAWPSPRYATKHKGPQMQSPQFSQAQDPKPCEALPKP